MDSYQERASYAWTEDSVRLIATPSSFAKSSLFYVQETGHFRTLAPYFTERNRLDSFLVVYTLSGTGRLSYGEKTYSLRQHQLFFIDCMNYHYYETDPDELWEILWVHANGGSIRRYYELFASESVPVVTLKPETAIPSILRQLIDMHRSFTYRTELIGANLLVDILTELLLTVKERDMPASGMPAYIGECMRYMEREFHGKIALEQLADRYSVSKYHLAKTFKKYVGFSPGEFLINTRVSYAKELLKYSDLTVSEIAAKVGVDNVSHFINLFKERVEHTPLVYRKIWNRPE